VLIEVEVNVKIEEVGSSKMLVVFTKVCIW
jgi:hypothetical protein